MALCSQFKYSLDGAPLLKKYLLDGAMLSIKIFARKRCRTSHSLDGAIVLFRCSVTLI